MQGYPFTFDIMSPMEKQPIYTLQTYRFENADLVQPPERDFEPHEAALNCLQGYRVAGLCVDVGAFTAALPYILPPGDILLNQLGIATAKVNNKNVMIPLEGEHKKDLNLLAGPMLHALASERMHKKRIDNAMLLVPALFPDAVRVEPTSKPNVKSVILDHVKLAPALRKTIMMMTHWLIADTVKTWEENNVVPEANFSFNPEDIQFMPSYLRSIAHLPLDVRTSVLERVSKLEDFLTELQQSEMPLQIAGLYDYKDAISKLQEKVTAQAQASKRPVQLEKKAGKKIPDQKKLDYVIAAEKRGLPTTPPKKKEERTTSPYDTARSAFLACIENVCNLENPSDTELDHWTLALQEFISIDLDLDAQDVIALISSFRSMRPEEIRKRVNNLFQGKELDYDRAYLKATFLLELDENTMYEMLEQGMIPDDLVNVYDALAQGNI